MRKFLSLFVVFLVFFSCQKDHYITSKTADNSVILKSWLQSQKQVATNNAAFIDSLTGVAQWSNLTVEKINDQEDLMYVPIKDKIGFAFIVKTSNNAIETGYLSKISSNNNTNTEAKTISNFYSYAGNFTGSISAYSFANALKWEVEYQSGQQLDIKSIKSSKDAPKAVYASSGAQRIAPQPDLATPPAGCTDYYMVTRYSDGTEEWSYIGTTCNSQCTVVRQIGGNGTTTENGAITTNCLTGGGTGGAARSSEAVDTVIATLQTPCIQTVLTSLMSDKLNTQLALILRNVFSSNDQLELTYVESSSLPAGTAGNTNPFMNLSNNNKDTFFRITTTLNTTMLASASQEFIAETLIHEAIHAYLDMQHPKILEMESHCIMIENYIDLETTLMQEMFPTLTNGNAHALILAGMGDVEQYDNATLITVCTHYGTDINTALQTNSKYENSTLGKKCPPIHTGPQT